MPTQLGVWTVQRRLGRGGMGTVYHCHNRLLPDIEAAVKTMDPQLAQSRRSRQRFIREAEVLFGLEHPHIVKVRNVHMDHDPPFLEMDFVAGEPLGSLLQERSLTMGASTTLAAQLCSAMAYLHARGVSHRDLKPDNVIVAGEHATLVDFGLVSEDHNATLSRPGALFGTLSYVPPEWGGVERPDGVAWDRYSLGVLLYEIFTAAPAFVCPPALPFAEQLSRIQGAKSSHPFLDPGPSYAPEVREILRRLTALDPGDRTCDLAAAADALQQLRQRMSAGLAEQKPAGESLALTASTPTWVTLPSHELAALQAGAPAAGGAATAVPEGHTWGKEGDAVLAPAATPQAPTQTSVADVSLVQPRVPMIEATGGTGRAWLGAGVALAVVGLVVGSIWRGSPSGGETPTVPVAQEWPLQLLLSPPVVELPVTAALDGRAFALATPPSVGAGKHHLQLRIGNDCGGDAAPVHCGQVDEHFDVLDSGVGAARRVRLLEVVAREVALEPGLALPARATVDGSTWTPLDPMPVLGGLLPGVHEVVVQVGRCPDTPCAGACEPVCSEATVQVVVPFEDGGRVQVEVPMSAPERPAAAPPKARTPPLYSVGRFQRWLERNPRYQRDAAIASGLAKERYLRRWSGTTPPAHLASGAAVTAQTPVETVSPAIAVKACGSRGLLSVDAAPSSWQVSAGGATPAYELRQDDAGPVLLVNNGTRLPVEVTESRPMVGFRCAP